MSAFKLSQRHIHVYENDRRVAVVKTGEIISCFCLEQAKPACDTEEKLQSSTWCLWIVTTSGRIFMIDDHFRHQTSSNDDNNDQDIFNTLLASQAATSSTVETEETPEESNILLKATDSNLQLNETVVSICVDNGILCVCSFLKVSHGVQYKISVFESKIIASDCGDARPLFTHNVFQKDSHLSDLPQKAAVFIINRYSMRDENDDMTRTFHQFYDTLFGTGATLLNSNVVLFSTPSGVVFFYNLKDLPSISNRDDRVLCPVDQPVVAFHSFATVNQSSGSLSNSFAFGPSPSSQSSSQTESSVVALAVIGLHGKCMLIYQSKQAIHHQTLVLPGPITASHGSGNKIYISTEEQLYRIEFNLVQAVEEAIKFKLSVTDLSFSNITGISSQPGSTVEGNILYCFSKKGRLYVVEDEKVDKLKHCAPASDLKDLLVSIGKTGEELDRMQNMVSKQNDTLAQLSIASKLAALSSSIAENPGNRKRLEKIIKTEVIPKQTGQGSIKKNFIVVSLRNVSVAEFSTDWVLMVTITRYKDLCLQNMVSTCSKSIPMLYGLKPGCLEEIEIPLTAEILAYPILNVSVFLVYDTPRSECNPLHSEISSDQLSHKQHPALGILMKEQKLDVLDFVSLTTSQDGSLKTSMTLLRPDFLSLSEIAQHLAEQRPSYKLFSSQLPSRTESKIDQHSLVIYLDTTLDPIQKCKDPAQVLKFILSLTNLGCEALISGDMIKVSTPVGKAVTLSVNQSPESTEEKPDVIGYQLTIQSEDLAIVVHVRAAFLERFSKISSTSGTKDGGGSVEETSILGLLQSVKNIKRKTDAVEAQSTGQGNTNRVTEDNYINAFKDLRNLRFPPC